MTAKKALIGCAIFLMFLLPGILHAQYFSGEDYGSSPDSSYSSTDGNDESTGENMDAVVAREFPPEPPSENQAPQTYQRPRQVERNQYDSVSNENIDNTDNTEETSSSDSNSYERQLPRHINTKEKVIIVDPVVHAWGAYTADGKLIHSGLATAGSAWCEDINRPCKTKAGAFRIYSLGNRDCYSSKYPIDEGGGAPMPYCMYFNGSQGLHGSNHVVEGNISHGCVRMREGDARWLRYNFAGIGTKVVVRAY